MFKTKNQYTCMGNFYKSITFYYRHEPSRIIYDSLIIYVPYDENIYLYLKNFEEQQNDKSLDFYELKKYNDSDSDSDIIDISKIQIVKYVLASPSRVCIVNKNKEIKILLDFESYTTILDFSKKNDNYIQYLIKKYQLNKIIEKL